MAGDPARDNREVVQDCVDVERRERMRSKRQNILSFDTMF